MLGRLYKHEMKASGHYFVPVYIGAALASVLFAIVWSINLMWKNDIFSSFTIPFAVLLFICIIGAIGMGTFIINMIRFYKTMVSEEGYLTHTLPVTTDQLLLSKGFVAVTYDLIGTIAVTLIIGLFIVLTVVASGAIHSSEWNYMMDAVATVFRELGNHGFSVTAYIIELIIAILVGFISKLFLVYLAIAIGQCMKSHKALWSIVFYICINLGIGLISQVIMTVVMLGFGISSTYDMWFDNYLGIYTHVTMWSGILMSLVMFVACYFLVRYIFQKRLNLE